MKTYTKQEVMARREARHGPRPGQAERIEEVRRGLAFQVALEELRAHRGVTQTTVSERIGTSRPNVARIENETDIRLSTLERYIAALGGRLEISAVFDDEAVKLLDDTDPSNT